MSVWQVTHNDDVKCMVRNMMSNRVDVIGVGRVGTNSVENRLRKIENRSESDQIGR